MKVVIVHDSKLGNGSQIAEAMQRTIEAAGHEVSLGHVNELDPSTAAAEKPDLVIVGAAVRAFMVSPATKKWLRGLKRALKQADHTVDAGAVFLTHGLPKNTADRWGTRLRRRMEKVHSIRSVYPDWLSGRVVGQEGPLEEGTLKRFEEQAKSLIAR